MPGSFVFLSQILKELRHPNLVRLDRVFTRPEKQEVDLVYEFAEHDLADMIKTNKQRWAQAQAAGMLHNKAALIAAGGGPTDNKCIKSILYQLLSGLAFLHKSWCMHRDLKPANILITAAGKVKIGQ